MRGRSWFVICSVLVVIAMAFTACGATATPTTVPTKAAATTAPTTAATKAPATATAVPPTPTAEAPAVGGTFVYAISQEPDTLDPHKSSMATASAIDSQLGASLTMIDPQGNFVPYLAESWKASADGLTWDFVIRKGVKFNNGDALTAKDFAWTFQRAMDPATKSPVAGTQLSAISKVEAVDDSTLRLTLEKPFFPILFNLSDPGWIQPLSKAAIEKAGDKYSHQPVGVGPYLFKEWVTGSKVVLERNPDFNWGPAYMHKGAYYIKTIEFRVIPELSTMVAGLEAGEITYADPYSGVQAKDIERIRALNKFQVFEGYQQGMRPFIEFNVTKAPFTDVKVRKAFNMAIDRAAMIKAIALGNGIEQKGPLSPSQIGYSSDVEKLGYTFDLAQAKALMKEAGYTADASGMLTKDGQPLKLKLDCLNIEFWVKVAEMAKEQLKALGVTVELQLGEPASLLAELAKGNFTFVVMGITGPEADLLYSMFHTKSIGGMNHSQISDPDLDQLLDSTRTLTDAAKRQEAVNQVQILVIDKAYTLALYVPKNFYVLSSQVKGAVFSARINSIYLGDAYFETK